MAEFGEKLREARQRKGVTQQTVADNVFVTRQAVSQWESGVRYPDLFTAKKLSEYLEIPLDSLLSEDKLSEYAERTPIMESPNTIGLQTAIYSVLSVLYLIIAVFSVSSLLFVDATPIEGDVNRSAFTGYVTSYTLLTLLMTVASIYGAVQAAQQKLTPRLAGWTGMVYFSIQILLKVCAILTRSSAPLGLALSCIIPLAGIVCTLRFFFSHKMKNVIPIFLICAIFSLGSIGGFLKNIYLLYAAESSQICPMIISLLCCIFTMGIISWQAYTLKQKRQRTDFLKKL